MKKGHLFFRLWPEIPEAETNLPLSRPSLLFFVRVIVSGPNSVEALFEVYLPQVQGELCKRLLSPEALRNGL